MFSPRLYVLGEFQENLWVGEVADGRMPIGFYLPSIEGFSSVSYRLTAKGQFYAYIHVHCVKHFYNCSTDFTLLSEFNFVRSGF